MPSRIIPFANGQYYHIYNRGTEKRWIFEKRRDYQRFIKTILYYQLLGPKPRFSDYSESNFKTDSAEKLVEIVAYCLMPNHFHILLKQLKDGGISEFVSKVSNSYTKYFNTKYDRVGPLLQGEFKAVLVETDEQLLHLSRYIHLNPFVSFLIDSLENYEWSSYLEYINNEIGMCNKQETLGFFKESGDYKNFIMDQASYAMELELIKHQLLED